MEIDMEQEDVALDSQLDPFEFYRFLKVSRGGQEGALCQRYFSLLNMPKPSLSFFDSPPPPILSQANPNQLPESSARLPPYSRRQSPASPDHRPTNNHR